MLGLFDSGLGGLTVLRAVRARLPQHDLVYLADQARVPYGGRPFGELYAFLEANLAYLTERGARAVVMACNTSCAVAAEYGWPPSPVPVLDLISSAAEAVAASGLRRIGVSATEATVRSGAYGRALRARVPGIEVQEVAAPELVPLVEAGTLAGPCVREAVARSVQAFQDVEAVVLACTHFPVLATHFAAVLGSSVRLIDPALAQAEATVLAAASIPAGTGVTHYATTGDVDAFTRRVREATGETDPIVHDAKAILAAVRP